MPWSPVGPVSAAWARSPETLKPTADQELLNGINRIVIHESAHQPVTDKIPGLTLGPFGQWFNRNETWAEQAGPWIDYLGRSSFLLQQGRFAADVVYFYGEDSNLTALFAHSAPQIPAGYGFDYINADALIHELKVQDGELTTPGGMRYKVLGLDPNSKHMSLPVLRGIHTLVSAGAVVAGAKPEDDPSLADDLAEFKKLSGELFGDGTGVHRVGKGTVYAGQSLKDAVAAMKLAPDFDYSRPEKDTRIEFAHRKVVDGEIYFVDNRSDRSAQVQASFRVMGKEAELWHAETGATEPASFKIADGRTTVPLTLEPWGTVFVVFRKSAQSTERTLPSVAETKVDTVSGAWKIAFQADRGAPAEITLEKLTSWTENSDAGVKYFSGAGIYTTTVNAQAGWFHDGARMWIDLGDVKNIAQVTVYGVALGEVWHAPFRVDATAALHPGANEVTVKVTNLWPNRMIGDLQPGVTKTYTWADVKPYKASSPLLSSGLMGPVTIWRAETAH